MKTSAFVTSHTVVMPKAGRQFVVACAADDDLAQAITALYYLPENYTMVVDGDRANTAHMIDKELSHRVRFSDDKTGLDEVPFSFADATLANGKVSAAAGSPAHNVSVRSPEAYASAILGVARAAA
jgi:hypothetical protein